MEDPKVKEMGITVDGFFGSEPKMKAKQFNSKLQLFREFALATLGTLIKSKKGGKSSYITACDSFAASGIAGLQWKKHFQTQVHVSMADHDDLSKLISNTHANSLDATEMTLNSVRVPGDPFQSQNEDEVHVYQADARALLSMEAFQFIYLSPYKNGPEYIDSAFNSVSHGGVVCFVVSDLSAFGRTPHVIRRQYAARVIKTEYWKELAARVVMAAIALAAARCNKGIIPQYVVSFEDFLLVCVKVGRGHVRSEAALNEVVPLMHCRFCEDKAFMEIQLAPEENPYSKLPCKCKQAHPGKTAVVIGPMWKGAIFDHEFLCELQECGTDLKLSNSFTEIVSLLISESFGSESKSKTQSNLPVVVSMHNSKGTGGENSEHSSTHSGQASELLTNQTNSADEGLSVSSVVGNSTSNNTSQEGSCGKRKAVADDGGSDVDVKKMRKETELGKDKKKVMLCQSSNVPFFYNVNKVKSANLPKIDKVISLLQQSGFKASRTHFDLCAVRTSASAEQLQKVLS